MRPIEFRAWWKDTMEPIPDFMEQYTIDVLNGESDNPFIYSQFTNLLDKNGKKMFEGDIVMVPGAKQAMQIVYQAPAFVMKIKASYKIWSEFILSPEQNQLQEVIGNIWENGDLINDSKNSKRD